MPRLTQCQRTCGVATPSNFTEMLYDMFHAVTRQTWSACGCSLVIQSPSCAISKNLPSSCICIARTQRTLAINPRKPPSTTVVKASVGGRFSICSVCVSFLSLRNWFILLWLRLTANRKAKARRTRTNLNALPWSLMPCQFIEAVGFGSANSL